MHNALSNECEVYSIYFISEFGLIASRFRSYSFVFVERKKASSIQNSYRKWGTRARVLSWTLVSGNSKNESRKRNVWRSQALQ